MSQNKFVIILKIFYIYFYHLHHIENIKDNFPSLIRSIGSRYTKNNYNKNKKLFDTLTPSRYNLKKTVLQNCYIQKILSGKYVQDNFPAVYLYIIRFEKEKLK